MKGSWLRRGLRSESGVKSAGGIVCGLSELRRGEGVNVNTYTREERMRGRRPFLSTSTLPLPAHLTSIIPIPRSALPNIKTKLFYFTTANSMFSSYAGSLMTWLAFTVVHAVFGSVIHWQHLLFQMSYGRTTKERRPSLYLLSRSSRSFCPRERGRRSECGRWVKVRWWGRVGKQGVSK